MQDEINAQATARRDALMRAATLIEFQARMMRERMAIALAQAGAAQVPAIAIPGANGVVNDQQAQMAAASKQNMAQFQGALGSLAAECQRFLAMLESHNGERGDGPPPLKFGG